MIDSSAVSVSALYVPGSGWDLRALYCGRDMGRFQVAGVAKDFDPESSEFIKQCAVWHVAREFDKMSAHQQMAWAARRAEAESC